MKITLRFTLATVIASLTVFTALTVFLVSYGGSRRSLMELTDNMTDEVAKGIIGKTSTLFDSAERANAELDFLIGSGILDTRDGQALMRTAAAFIRDNEGFTSVDIGLPNGDKYKAERMPDDSVSMRCYVRDAHGVRMTWQHANPAYNDDPAFKNTVKDLAKGYDARTRPWWKAAIAKGGAAWTDIYVSGLRKQFVYSCVAPIYNAKHELLAVTSIDINVVTLSQFLGTLQILQHGKAFILNDKHQVIAVPMHGEEDINQLVRHNPADTENPYALYPLDGLPDVTLRKAVELFLLRSATKENAGRFEFAGADGATIICRMMRFPYRSDAQFAVGIAIPESDILAGVNRRSRVIFAGIAGLTGIALLLGLTLAKAMSRSLTVLAGEVDKVGRLDLSSDAVVTSRLLEVHDIAAAVAGMRSSLRSFKKYVPADLVLQLHALRKEAMLEGERREVTAFFSDIAGFTRLAEALAPEALVTNLGAYFEAVSHVILERHGTVDKYIGDSVMAFWGAPLPREDHAIQACEAALDCRERLEALRARFTVAGQPVFETRIGLHSGEVIVGNIGSPDRMNYTIIGDAVNLASRLEGLNKVYGTHILVSESCYQRTGDRFVARRLDCVAVKGKAKGVVVRELVGRAGQVDAARLAAIARYEEGLDAYLARRWEDAETAFAEACAASREKDPAAALMADRCRANLASAPPEDWDGVFCATEK